MSLGEDRRKPPNDPISDDRMEVRGGSNSRLLVGICIMVGGLLGIGAILEAAGGHGSYLMAKLSFPYSMALTAFSGNLGFRESALALVQFPAYGLWLHLGVRRGKTTGSLLLLLAVHLLAAGVALFAAHENFP